MATVFKAGEQSVADPFEFVMSDESVDRVGDVLMASGWQLAEFRKNPVALWGHDARNPIGTWQNVRVQGGRLIGKLVLAQRGTSGWIDTLWSLIEQRVLRAVSVGFSPIKSQPIDADRPYGPQRYLRQVLLECSLVSVPANPNALALAKSIAPEFRARVFAESGIDPLAGKAAGSAQPGGRTFLPTSTRKGAKMSLGERIAAAQQRLVALRDAQAPYVQRVDAERELSADEAAEFDRINTEVDAEEGNLSRLQASERALASRLTPADPAPRGPAAPYVGRFGAGQRGSRPSGRPMDLLVKMGACTLLAHIKRLPVEAVLRERYVRDEELGAVVKAVTNPAQTDVAGWAAELVDSAIADFMEALTPESAYAQLAPKGARFTFGRNGAIKIPRRNGPGLNAPGDLRGAFVGEGNPIPVRRGSIGSVSLMPFKLGVISTYTREIAAHSTPAIESIIRQGILEDTAIALDTALLDATPAIAGVRPAGLLNGVVPIAGAAGGGVEAITADFAAALQVFTAANAASGLAVLLNPAKVISLQWATTPLGTYPFRDGANAGTIGGFPLITSTTIPIDQMTMIRAADFASATGDSPEFDISDTATLHEVDGDYPANQAMPDPPVAPAPLPIVDGAGVAAAPVRSLWQTASIGIRMLLDVSWGMRRSGMVVQVDGITW